MGEPVVVAARLPKNVDRVVLEGSRDGAPVRMELGLGGGADHAGVSRLWARRKVASLMDGLHEGRRIGDVSSEVAALGVRHQLVTRWSSLVAVDVTPTAPVDAETDTRAIPSLLPEGWDFSKIFGSGKPAAAPSGPHPAPADAGPPTTTAGFAIEQRFARVQVGALPQGGTPATLLIGLGASCLGTGSGLLAWGRRRSVQSEERAS